MIINLNECRSRTNEQRQRKAGEKEERAQLAEEYHRWNSRKHSGGSHEFVLTVVSVIKPSIKPSGCARHFPHRGRRLGRFSFESGMRGNPHRTSG